jgi:hypothetical protein
LLEEVRWARLQSTELAEKVATEERNLKRQNEHVSAMEQQSKDLEA